MVVGTGLPVIGSGIVLGTAMALPSTTTLTVSGAGGAAGFVEAVSAVGMVKLSRLRVSSSGGWRGCRRWGGGGRGGRLGGGGGGFGRGAFGDELVLELADEALHRPGAGFAEGADGAAARNIIRDLDQVIRILGAALAVGEAMERFAHPERTFAARRALSAAFVRVKLADVGQRL